VEGIILRGTESISPGVLNEHRTAQKMGKQIKQKTMIAAV
jgi:hypothetical protein